MSLPLVVHSLPPSFIHGIMFVILRVLLYLLFQLFLAHLQAATTVGELVWGPVFHHSDLKQRFILQKLRLKSLGS